MNSNLSLYEERKRQKEVAFWQSCINDWNKFARDVLGANLDKEQQAIIDAIQHEPRISVRSGTARGKDYVTAVGAMCFMYLTPRFNRQGDMIANTKVALTAPTDRQVKNIMIPEIKRLWYTANKRGFGLRGRLTGYDIRTENAEWFLTGFKADEHNHEAWSGFHATNVMFAVTEATGISDDTFSAIEGNLQGNSRLLLVFNPNKTTGYAAQSQAQDRWAKFRLSSLSAPNVLAKKIIINGQVDYDWVQDKIDNWCTQIRTEDVKPSENDFEFEGKWYRPSDLFRKKVLGEFPKVADDILIPQTWIEQAMERWKTETHPTDGNDVIIGSDVAGMGRDCSVECHRQGNYTRFNIRNSGGQANHMETAGSLIQYAQTHSNIVVSIDTIGEGAGVFSRCEEIARTSRDLNPNNFISCKFSESAKWRGKELTDSTGQYQFANMRAYLHWCVREWLNPDNNTGAMIPPDCGLIEEASQIHYSFLSSGKIIIEPKEDIKKRLGHSPDVCDALCNTFHPKAMETLRNGTIGGQRTMSDAEIEDLMF